MSEIKTYTVSEGCMFDGIDEAMEHDEVGPWGDLIETNYYHTALKKIAELEKENERLEQSHCPHCGRKREVESE